MSNLIKFIVENNLESEMFVGIVLWWSDKNGNGIIRLDNGSEVYFDSSVVKHCPVKGELVGFTFNVKIQDCACAKIVKQVVEVCNE